MDRDRIKIILKDKLEEALDVGVLAERDFFIGNKTMDSMAEAALHVLLAVEEVQDYLASEGYLKN